MKRLAGRRLVVAALKVGLYSLVVAFLCYKLWQVRQGVVTSLHIVGWGNVALATALCIVGGVPGFIGWRFLLGRLGTRLPLPTAMRLFFLAGLTRYLPGGVWPTVAHATAARPLGESPVRMGGAFAACQGLGVTGGLVVAMLALPRLIAVNAIWWLLLPAVAVALVPVAVPQFLKVLLGLAQRIFRRGTKPLELPERSTLATVTALLGLGWLITGIQLSVLAVALGASPAAALTLGVGGYAVSVTIGLFAVMTPSGLGVREILLALTLGTMLSGSRLVTLIALSRVVTTVADMGSTAVVLGLLTLIDRRRHQPSHVIESHLIEQPEEQGVSLP
jgi:uncharacterized membrane protein YbhN (UPF0104 family)